jgi:ATP-binding cassette subfamily C protein
MIGGRNAVYISHRLASTRFCDAIAFFRDGGLSEYGTHDSLLAQNGGYAEAYKAQSQYYREEAVQ